MRITKPMLVIEITHFGKSAKKHAGDGDGSLHINRDTESAVAIEQMFGVPTATESLFTPFYGPALAIGITASSQAW